MMNFREILEWILTSLQYKKVQSEELFDVYEFNRKRGQQHFYIITDNFKVEDIVDFNEQQRDLFEKITVDDPAFLKNTYWVLGVEEIEEELIFRIEENEYFFKKFVLQYKQQELVDFTTHFTESDNMIEKIHRVVEDMERFDKFTEGQDSLYKFVSSLLIKMPSLKMPSFRGENNEEISLKIEKELIENKLDEGNKILHMNQSLIEEYLTDESKFNEVLKVLEQIEGEEKNV